MSLAYDVIPVTLLTGFLGSGKSTLLADVLTGKAARDTAVLVNEFGAIGLDHLLLGDIDAQTVLLDNGCICCSIRGELKDALAALFSRRARGEVPPFSHVVLETTGLATPAPIVATLLADPVVRSHFVLNATVTVVDAVNAAQQRLRHPEWLAQVCAADRLLLSKTDLVDAASVDALAAMLATLNPAASVLARDPSGGAHALLGIVLEPASQTGVIGRLGSGSHALAASGSGAWRAPGALAHHAGENAPDIRAFSMRIDAPLDWQVFTLWFTMLLSRHGDRILRVKALLSIAGSDRPAALHAVRHLVHPILHLAKWPDGTAPVSQLVFITEGLPGDALEASYRRFCHHLEAGVH
jgi:G3E family GTPase